MKTRRGLKKQKYDIECVVEWNPVQITAILFYFYFFKQLQLF